MWHNGKIRFHWLLLVAVMSLVAYQVTRILATGAPYAEIIQIIMLQVGIWLWPFSLLVFVWIRAGLKAWGEPGADPMHGTIYSGLRSGPRLTLVAFIVLALALIPTKAWMIFYLILAFAWTTPPVLMLSTAVGLIAGAVRNRDRLSGHEQQKTVAAILALIALGTAWLILVLPWFAQLD
jgi:hypothetical protein